MTTWGLNPGLPWSDVGLLGFLLVVLPVLGVLQARAVQDIEIERIPVYVSTVATVVILTAVTWSLGAGSGGAAALGLTPLRLGALVSWSLGLVVAGLVIVAFFRQVGLLLGWREQPVLRRLLPRGPDERAAFGLVSLSAGVGEEIIFRGYALGTLLPVLGTGWAVAVTSVAFGVLHAYQGPLGIVRTGAMGAVLAWGFLASGSLWPPVVAHTLLDLVMGLLLGERLMVPPADTGVEDTEADERPPHTHGA